MQSEKKATLPGRKQVYRHYDRQGLMCGDWLALEDEVPEPPGSAAPAPAEVSSGEPLLQLVMAKGERVNASGTLEESREHHRAHMRRLPPALRALDAEPSYPVSVSAALTQLGERTDEYIRRHLELEADELGIS